MYRQMRVTKGERLLGDSIVYRSKNHLWDTCSESRNHLEAKANGEMRNESF